MRKFFWKIYIVFAKFQLRNKYVKLVCGYVFEISVVAVSSQMLKRVACGSSLLQIYVKRGYKTLRLWLNIFLRDRLIYGGIWKWASVSTLLAEINCRPSVCTSMEMRKVLNSKKRLLTFEKTKKKIRFQYIYIQKGSAFLESRKTNQIEFPVEMIPFSFFYFTNLYSFPNNIIFSDKWARLVREKWEL